MESITNKFMVKTSQAAHDRFSSVQVNFHKVVKKCRVTEVFRFFVIKEYQFRATVFGIDMF